MYFITYWTRPCTCKSDPLVLHDITNNRISYNLPSKCRTTIMGSGFNVWSAAGRALLYAFTSQYHSYPTDTPLIPHSYCTHTPLILHSYCAHTPLILHSYPTNAVLILHPYSTHSQRTLILHSYSKDSPCLSSVKECAQGSRFPLPAG